MASFKLDSVMGRIRPSRLVRATTEADGSNGTVRKVTEVELVMEIGHVKGAGDVDKSFARAIEGLWPGVGDMIAKVTMDEDRPGFDLTARGKLPDVTADIFGLDPKAAEGTEPVFHLSAARAAGKPRLKVDDAGDAVLCLRLRGKFKRADLGKVTQYIEADVWVTCDPAQVDMADAGGKVVATIGKNA